MEKTKLPRVKGFSNNGVFHPGQGHFDQDYISIEIVDKVVKVGEGENDFIVTKAVIETKKPIKEVVSVDKDQVGVYNIIKQVMRTGDTSLLPVDKGDCHVDFVGAPENLMEVKALGEKAERSFKALPKELTGSMDMKAFIEGMSQEKFNEFVKAIADRQAQKEGKKDGE